MMVVTPKRWVLYQVEFDLPSNGNGKAHLGKTKTKKKSSSNLRICLAIQPSEFSEAGLESTVVLPITSNVLKTEAFPLRVRLPANLSGLKKEHEILVDQIFACENDRFRKEICPLPEELQEQVIRAVADFLSL